nr:hypothetical protein [Tanacetum cinerariifolium]
MGTVQEPLAEGTKGAPHLGPKRPRVYSDLSPEEKDRYNANIRATNILLQGLPKDIYTLINHYIDAKDKWDNVKMLLEGSESTKEDRESQPGAVGYERVQNRVGNANPGQARQVKCYNCNGIRHIARNCTQPKHPQNSDYYKDKMLLMQAQENGVALDTEQLLFLADDCDAFDSDVDEAPTAQTMFMANLSSADPVNDEDGPSYDSDILSEQVQPALYNGHEIIRDNHVPTIVHNTKDTLEIAEITRRKMNDKMKDQKCVTHKVKIAPHDYSKENFLATFTPQKQLTPEQIFWSQDLIKLKYEALREQTTVSRLIKALTVYPPNTPATLVPRVLPTKIQVKIYIFTLIQLFSEFDKTCKKRITPTGLTEGERGFEQTKECYLKEVIPFFKTLKDHFKGIQKALTKEIKEMKDVFEELEAGVAQNVVDRKHDEIEQKNLLIANDNLIDECLSKEVFSVATNSDLNIARFTEMHVANTMVKARCLELEAELSNLRDKSHNDNHDELVNRFSNLEKISHLQETRIDTDRTLKVRTVDSQITQLTEKVTVLQAQNDVFRAENDKIKQHYKELYDSIKITRTKHIEQVTTLTTKKVNLKAQILDTINSVSKDHVKPKVLAPGKYAIDVEPIVPRLRNNREAHLDYLRHLKESVETIHDIVEEAKVVRPLDSLIFSAFRYTKYSQELLEYAIGTCPQDSYQRDKKLAHAPLIRKKQVTFAEPSDTSNSNTHKHVAKLNTQKTNVPVPPSIGVNRCTNTSGSQPRSNTKKSRISPAKCVNKMQVEEQPRANKSHLRTTNRVDSSSRSKSTIINLNSDSVCQTCNKCLISVNHDMCVIDYLQSVVTLLSIDNNCHVVHIVKQNGDQQLPHVTQLSIAGTSSIEQPPLKDKSMWSDQEKKIQKIDHLARSILIQGLPNDIYSLIDRNKTTKDLWDALARHMLGSEYGEKDRKAAILYEYETFKATEGELLLDTYIRYLQVINDLKKCGYSKDNCELNFKFLNNLQPEWKHYATMMRQNKNLMDINIDALYNILKQNQGDVNDAMGSKKKTVVVTSDPLALIAEKTKAFNQIKFYSKPTNNNLRTSSSSQSANKKQEFVKMGDKKEDKKADEKKRDMSRKDKDEQVLLAKDQAWMESSSDSDQEINANMVSMAQIEKVLLDSEASSSSADEKISEELEKVDYEILDLELENGSNDQFDKNGDQLLPRVTQVSIARTSLTEQPPLKDKSMCNKIAKDLWDALSRHMLGSEYGKQDRKAAVLYEYETFKAIEGELLLDTYIRYLQSAKQYATKMRQNKNLMDINIDYLYNILKKNQGDVNDAMGLKKKTVVVTSDPLTLIAEKTKITSYVAKAFNQRKFYSKPTNNNLRTSSTSQSANKKQEFVKTNEKKDDEKKRDMGKKDKDEQVLLAEDQAWMESSNDSDESEYETLDYYDNTTTYGLFMNNNDDQEIFHDFESFPENLIESQIDHNESAIDHNNSEGVDNSLKPYVSTVILEKIIIDLGDEVMSLLEKEKVNMETIESLKSKGFESSENVISESENQNENDCQVVEKECDNVENSKVIDPEMFTLNLDTLSSVRRPNSNGVMWMRKGSSNTVKADLYSVSQLKLNKDVKRYSRKDLLSCNNSHLGETSSAYVYNDVMNVSCNSRLCDSFDENNLFIFDDISVRNYPVCKMSFRKKPRDSMNVQSKNCPDLSLDPRFKMFKAYDGLSNILIVIEKITSTSEHTEELDVWFSLVHELISSFMEMFSHKEGETPNGDQALYCCGVWHMGRSNKEKNRRSLSNMDTRFKVERYKSQERVLNELKHDEKASTSYESSQEIESLKHTLSEYLKEKESLEQKITILKDDFQKEESRNIDRELALDKQALGFQNPRYLKKAQQLKPNMYDGSVIGKSDVIVLSTDFNTQFVPQTESYAEQAFCSQYLVQTDEPNLSGTTIVEVLKELPKVSMETFREACERFKEMIRACPHHGFTELAQIDNFYNGLNDNDQDSLNDAVDGNLL